MLPKLTINRDFMADFAEAEPPCFALGLVEIDDGQTGFLAMRPAKAIPRDVLNDGFQFGHALYGAREAVLSHLVFRFYGHTLYQALVNPAQPMVRSIVATMVERGDYLFFVLNPGDRVSAYRSEIGEENLSGMRDTLPRMQSATTTNDQYEQGVRAFVRNPEPEGVLMPWVCRDNPDYLDLTRNAVTLNPADPA